MKEMKITRDLYLWCMSIIYLSAFCSVYHQLPGLYGDNGILPARSVVTLEADENVVKKKAREIPTFLWLAPALGLDVPLMMDALCILGIFLSFSCMVWGRMRDMTNFTLLWMFYFSIFQVGQTFLWFQWDTLLLEAGFITIFVAPLGLLQSIVRVGPFLSLPHRPHDTVGLWLVRWLLFRLMFASGIVKLTSLCPTWWKLTALNHHFESQCIPTPLAWYSHHIPHWLLQLGVVGTYVIEIAVPFLFFIPVRSLRAFAFYSQVLFQTLIIVTGNYTFFNLLTMTLCLSLIDDEFLLNFVGCPPPRPKAASGAAFRYTRYLLTVLVEIVVYGGLIYWTAYFFSLKIKPDWTLQSNIVFSEKKFQKLLLNILPIVICIGVFSLGGHILLAYYRSFQQSGLLRKIWSLFGTTFVSGVACWLFTISLVPLSSLHVQTQRTLWPILNTWHKNVDIFHISNTYGLFRRMTGVEGRPEIVIEGSNSATHGWKEYHFLYKPGDMSVAPSFLIPHQPRLDWQMWFAALGSYEHNPWFVSFIFRLLEGRKEVLDLLDKDRLPFPAHQPPKFIRATLYKYYFAPLSTEKRTTKDWWTRQKVKEYFNSGDLEGNRLVQFLNAAGIHLEKTRFIRVTNLPLKKLLLKIRQYVETLKPTTFIWSLLGTGLCIDLLVPIMRLH